MSTPLEMTCPHCATTLGADPKTHRVYRCQNPHGTLDAPLARCERCGGHWYGASWRYTCHACELDVPPGALRGLFVPHLCERCVQQKVAREKAQGHICRLCGNVYAQCCC